ncbi:MAG: hypothetical protein ACTSQP_13260 [Promethearchaeota archaeon]
MTFLKNYLSFCHKLGKFNFPELYLKKNSKEYILLYRSQFNIDISEINKATFFIFWVIYFSSFLILFMIQIIQLLFIIIIAFFIAFLFSYNFNSILYKKLRKEENLLNVFLFFIVLDYSLIQEIYSKTDDLCINFINLIIRYNIPISKKFKEILNKIQEGSNPEKELKLILTPSPDFNVFLKNLLISNFSLNINPNEINLNTLENRFKIYLKSLETKISLIFFIGLFYPIGLCFLIIFQIINILFLFGVILLFFFILKITYKKFINFNYLLIGILKEKEKIEKKKFEEFLLYLRSFALYLKLDNSPERAFIYAFYENKNFLYTLKSILELHISKLLYFHYNLNDFISILKEEFNSFHFNLILNSLIRMLKEDPLKTSKKIVNFINLVSYHKKLEKRLEVILNSEKFKVILFLFLLPSILGSIGGFFPFFSFLNDQTLNLGYMKISYFVKLIRFLSIILTLLICNSITAYYFLRILDKKQNFYFILLSDIIFIFCLLISLTISLQFF